jgi:hypothetical protein
MYISERMFATHAVTELRLAEIADITSQNQIAPEHTRRSDVVSTKKNNVQKKKEENQFENQLPTFPFFRMNPSR